MENDFDSVSWQNEAASKSGNVDNGPAGGSSGPGPGATRSNSIPQQTGNTADAVDLGGIGDGKLECAVNSPLKENDGTKDAYVSYLVTTDVSSGRLFPDILFRAALAYVKPFISISLANPSTILRQTSSPLLNLT